LLSAANGVTYFKLSLARLQFAYRVCDIGPTHNRVPAAAEEHTQAIFRS
jgi:hypothetical protein